VDSFFSAREFLLGEGQGAQECAAFLALDTHAHKVGASKQDKEWRTQGDNGMLAAWKRLHNCVPTC
jgi:hypothetical protein